MAIGWATEESVTNRPMNATWLDMCSVVGIRHTEVYGFVFLLFLLFCELAQSFGNLGYFRFFSPDSCVTFIDCFLDSWERVNVDHIVFISGIETHDHHSSLH